MCNIVQEHNNSTRSRAIFSQGQCINELQLPIGHSLFLRKGLGVKPSKSPLLPENCVPLWSPLLADWIRSMLVMSRRHHWTLLFQIRRFQRRYWKRRALPCDHYEPVSIKMDKLDMANRLFNVWGWRTVGQYLIIDLIFQSWTHCTNHSRRVLGQKFTWYPQTLEISIPWKFSYKN